MGKIIECVPNFSEGRDSALIERIVEPLKNRAGFRLVSYEPDQDYNRTVVTLLGDGEAMIQPLLEFVDRARIAIDLNHHSGQHPRMGAVDVIPFIPIAEATVEECVALAERLGALVSQTFDIPVFLYALAAKKPDRVALPNIRKGEFEGMKDKIREPEWVPDFGRPEIHPTFGTVAIGCRIPLVAYNIDLGTTDEKIAEKLSRVIRQSSGGFQHIQAGPAFLAARGHVQVTMNILDYRKNPVYRIWETVQMEAKRFHVEVPSCEIVGLMPKEALLDSLKYYFAVAGRPFPAAMPIETAVSEGIRYLHLRDFDAAKIIESHLKPEEIR
ncbi:MAG TPA: glutamate formimidoyltransferase [Candidatus Izemoplasmatales bacterium]|nr:glutamate formimidoyltransferase [Candidatus Izemoplasmatales bacterium]